MISNPHNYEIVAHDVSNKVLSQGLYHALTHIRSAVRFNQCLQTKIGIKKTLLINTFILMNDTGMWATGFSLLDIYPKIDRLIELGVISKRKNRESDLYDSYFLTDAIWLRPFRNFDKNPTNLN